MKMIRTISVAATLFLLSFCCSAQTAQQVIDNYFAAVGGKAKMEAIDGMAVIGSVFVSQGTNTRKMIFNSHQKKDGRLRYQLMTGTARTFIIQGFDGSTAWQGRESNYSIMQGNERLELIYSPFLSRFLDMDTYGLKLRYLRELANAHTLYMEDVIGRKVFVDFDKSTHLVLEERFKNLQGKSVTIEYGAYKEYSGIKLPTRVNYSVNTDPDNNPDTFKLSDLFEMKYTYETIYLNGDRFQDNLFTKPSN